MTIFRHTIMPVILATLWISVSEFARNEFLLKSQWTRHYDTLGIPFPSEPINGAMWGIWSLLFAILIYLISRKFDLLQTTVISWLAAFAMMWMVIGNLSVLPFSILPFAIPLSLLESFIASWIIIRTAGAKT
jgi:hypothetical protein